VVKGAGDDAYLSKYHCCGHAHAYDSWCGLASHITSKALIVHRVAALVSAKYSAPTFGLKHVDRIIQLPTIELWMTPCRGDAEASRMKTFMPQASHQHVHTYSTRACVSAISTLQLRRGCVDLVPKCSVGLDDARIMGRGCVQAEHHHDPWTMATPRSLMSGAWVIVKRGSAGSVVLPAITRAL